MVGSYLISAVTNILLFCLQVEEKFSKIRQLISGMPYERHVISDFFAVENNMFDGEDPEVLLYFFPYDNALLGKYFDAIV